MSFSDRNVLNSIGFKLQDYLFINKIVDEDKFESYEISSLNDGRGLVLINFTNKRSNKNIDEYVKYLILEESNTKNTGKVELKLIDESTENCYCDEKTKYFCLVNDGFEDLKDCYVRFFFEDDQLCFEISKNLMKVFKGE